MLMAFLTMQKGSGVAGAVQRGGLPRATGMFNFAWGGGTFFLFLLFWGSAAFVYVEV